MSELPEAVQQLLEKFAAICREEKATDGPPQSNLYVEGIEEVTDALEAAWPRIEAQVRLDEHLLICNCCGDESLKRAGITCERGDELRIFS